MDREAWRAATHGAAGSEAAEPSCLSGEARPAPCGPLPPPRPRFRQRLPVLLLSGSLSSGGWGGAPSGGQLSVLASWGVPDHRSPSEALPRCLGHHPLFSGFFREGALWVPSPGSSPPQTS